MIKIKLYFLIVFVVFFNFSCTKKDSNNVGENSLPPHWKLLEVTKKMKSVNVYSWQFKLKKAITYDIQILLDSLVSDSITASYSIGSFSANQILTHDYTTKLNPKATVVAQFKKNVKLVADENYTLTIKTNADVKQVRLVPNYKNYIGTGKFDEEWKTMHQSKEKQNALQWFKQAKFGMFIHWGLYSQIGGVWKGEKMEQSKFPGPGVAEWLMHKFHISRAEYSELAKNFNPDKSFASTIAKLAKSAGMKYLIITSKHHDGFALFNSTCSKYDVVDATPYKEDALKELYDACQAEGIDFGVYYSHGHDWADGGDGNYYITKKTNDSLGVFTHSNGRNLWDKSPNSFDEYLESKALPQVKELINLLPNLKIIWFDGTGFISEDQAFKFYKTVYDLNPNILVNRRVGADFGDYLDFGDNVIPSSKTKTAMLWETCGTTNNSWGYKSYDQNWKSTKELLYWFVDINSKGGNYLLNIGPDGKGHVPVASANGLKAIGKWLKVNGEAIYGTSTWKVFHEGDEEIEIGGTGQRAHHGFSKKFSNKEFWFTTKDNFVYAISLMPSKETIIIKSWKKEALDIKQLEIIGMKQEISWEQSEEGLTIKLEHPIEIKDGFVVKAIY